MLPRAQGRRGRPRPDCRCTLPTGVTRQRKGEGQEEARRATQAEAGTCCPRTCSGSGKSPWVPGGPLQQGASGSAWLEAASPGPRPQRACAELRQELSAGERRFSRGDLGISPTPNTFLPAPLEWPRLPTSSHAGSRCCDLLVRCCCLGGARSLWLATADHSPQGHWVVSGA